MTKRLTTACLSFALFTILAASVFSQSTNTNTFVVAAYNVENWVLMDRNGQKNQPKPQKEKEAVWSVLAKVQPDVLGVEEMGTPNELEDLIGGLHEKGLDYPYREWIEGADPTRHVSLLSRFPIAARFSRTDYSYPLKGKPMRVERGFIDVKIQVNSNYWFRAIVAHLKSKRQSNIGDQAVMRLEEARLLRSHIGKVLKNDPRSNLIVMGDFNDTPESEAIRTIVGVSPFALFDLMPVDSKGGHDTHYWKFRDLYSRIDYLITSPGLSNEYAEDSAHIADVPEWNDASDHRAIYARFYDHDIGEPPSNAPEVDTAPPVSQPAAEQTTAPPSPPPYAKLVIATVVVVIVVAVVTIIVYRRRQSPKS